MKTIPSILESDDAAELSIKTSLAHTQTKTAARKLKGISIRMVLL
jgi:hypothetical protein